MRRIHAPSRVVNTAVVARLQAAAAAAAAAAATFHVALGFRWGGFENEQSVTRTRIGEKPIVDVPEDLNRSLVDDNRLIAAKFPLQILDLNQNDAVDADPHLGIFSAGGGNFNDNIAFLTAIVESSPSGKAFLSEHVFLFVNQERFNERRSGFGSFVGFLLVIA